MACLSPDDLVELLEGRLPPATTAALEDHAQGCDACRALLAESVRAAFPEGEPQGRYQLVRPIGAGGMGVVYEAKDLELQRSVALKMLRPAGDAAALRERLLAEARAMARLSHPNVLAVHDVGTLDGSVFLAMELVDGQTLGAWLKQRRQWREVVDVFLPAARGLAAAHAAGLVHRDFKPDNVLVGNDGRVRVTDFGLARAAPGPLDGARRAGTASTFAGSPAYMAPEQLRGAAVDQRADVFSFCVALHEGLYGARPFEGETVAALEAAIVRGQPRTPRADVPARLRRVVLRGLRAAPEERYASMGALVAALEEARRPALLPPLVALAAALAVAAALFLLRRAPAGDALDQDLHAVLTKLGAGTYVVPPIFKERVRAHLEQLQRNPHRADVFRRKQALWPMISRELGALGLPEELGYVVWAESRFDPLARSPTGSFGLWQLSATQARHYGLRVDDTEDERADPVKSTRVAARYLADLLALFGADASFMLGLASYNAGERAVQQALLTVAQEPGGFARDQRDFWNLYRRKLLSQETREYVPEVIAAAIAGSHPERYGLAPAR